MDHNLIEVEISAHTHEAWLRDMEAEGFEVYHKDVELPLIKADGYVTCQLDHDIWVTLQETSPDIEDAIRKLIGMKNH